MTATYTKAECVAIMLRTFDRYYLDGNDQDTAINLTAAEHNIDATRVAHFVWQREDRFERDCARIRSEQGWR